MSDPILDDDLDAQFAAIQAKAAAIATQPIPQPDIPTPEVAEPTMPPNPNSPQPTPEQIAAFLDSQKRMVSQEQTPATSQPPSLLLPAVVLVAGMLAAVWLFTWMRSPGGDDDLPQPIPSEVVQAFDDAATTFMTDFGADVIAIGEQVKRGEITTVSQWRDATRDAYTARDNEFIKTTGEWDGKYVPQETVEFSIKELNEMSPMEKDLMTNPPLTESQRRVLGDYTIASGQGLQEAVK